MIKINLLPHRVEKIKKGLGREELIYIGIGALTLLIVSVSFALIFFFDSAKKKETQTLKKEQARLTLVTKEIQELQKVQKEADERLAVIKKLNQGRKDIVKVLDELNGALPPKVWLTSLKQDKDRFSIEGYASDSNFISPVVLST